MKQHGFTLIELLITIVFVLTLGMIVITFVGAGTAAMSGNSSITYGINGMTEARCIEGYKFIINQDGHTRQILDELGKGVKCN